MSKHHFHEVVLQPGELFVGEARHRIKTLLGSCVSITLWDAHRRIGAMSHFLLPERLGGNAAQLDGRYGREALSLMIAGLHAKGVVVEQCIAKVFGGGDMFPARPAKTALPAVGQQNGEAARSLLREHGLTPRSECLFGAGHRQIIFDVQTGDVWVRKVALDADGKPDTTSQRRMQHNEERKHEHDQGDGGRRLGGRAAGGHGLAESGQWHRSHRGGR